MPSVKLVPPDSPIRQARHANKCTKEPEGEFKRGDKAPVNAPAHRWHATRF